MHKICNGIRFIYTLGPMSKRVIPIYLKHILRVKKKTIKTDFVNI